MNRQDTLNTPSPSGRAGVGPRFIIILGDGMADHKVDSLGNKTPLEAADIPTIDELARKGKTGRLITVPEGFPPGSEVANTCILGYDMETVYEGRGPLEAASIGYEMQPDDLAIRCNIISLQDGRIQNHHGGHLSTEEARVLIDYLNENLAGEYRFGEKTAEVRFIAGIQYRHLLIIKGGNKNVDCAPPHDHPGEPWQALVPRPLPKRESFETASLQNSLPHPVDSLSPRFPCPASPLPGNSLPFSGVSCPSPKLSPEETAALFTDLILKSQDLLAAHPINKARAAQGKLQANSIWMWSGGYRPSMQTLSAQFPQIKSGAVISAVDLIKGIGHYAGLRVIDVPGATGLADTNYEGKAQAAIEALENGDDFVFLHVEASDEAGHDGDVQLKIKTIEYLNDRIVKPIYDYAIQSDKKIIIAVLPDHPTPVEQRIHVNEPIPFLIWHKGIEPDAVQEYNEQSCVTGGFGLLKLREFIETFMKQ